MLKRTPLYEVHARLGARLVEFGGWEMPVQYTSIFEEHQTVRQAAGLFDISHMGEFLVSGPAAEDYLNRVLTNDVRKLQPGQGQYTLLCRDDGGVVDDLYVFRLEPQKYLLIVNASRIAADYEWMHELETTLAQSDQLQLVNASAQYGAIAVQGPRVIEFFDQCVSHSNATPPATSLPSQLRKNQLGPFHIGGVPAWVSRTGYTGEDGFEVVAPADRIPSIWEVIAGTGQSVGLKPAGLGARDTLRLEAGYPLYGHELDEKTTPLDAGLDRFVCLTKPPFLGHTALSAQARDGVQKKLVAFRMTDKSPPPRSHYAVYATAQAHDPIGIVTSGTQSPSLGIGVGMAYVPPASAAPGTHLAIDIRSRRYPAAVVPKPLFSKRPRR